MKKNIAGAVSALAAALCLLGLIAIPAGASVRPEVGVIGQWNKPMCGSNDWERIKLPNTELAVIDVTPQGFKVIDMVPGMTLAALQERTEATLRAA